MAGTFVVAAIPGCELRVPTREGRRSAVKFLRGLGSCGAALFPFFRGSAGLVGVIPGALAKDGGQFLALFWKRLGGDAKVLVEAAAPLFEREISDAEIPF
jgi:hypothetical protein